MSAFEMIVETKIKCNFTRCSEVAEKLRSMSVPFPKEDVPPLPFTIEEEANFWFLLAGICHQTSPVGKPALEGAIDGAYRRGWDYLVHAFREAATSNKELLDPKNWVKFDANQMIAIFGDRLSYPDRRAAMVVNLGQVLIELGWKSILVAAKECSGYLTNHSPNLLQILSKFKAYSDPVEKKSVFFLALMQNCGLWTYFDAASLPAPVDYHEVRGHLRIGTVKIEDVELERKIKSGESVSDVDDIVLRMAVRDAIQFIADRVGNSPNALHYFFWNLFRTYCVRTTPHCDGSNYSKLPEDYAKAVLSAGGRACPFRKFCDSADDLNAINEHQIATEFY